MSLATDSLVQPIVVLVDQHEPGTAEDAIRAVAVASVTAYLNVRPHDAMRGRNGWPGRSPSLFGEPMRKYSLS
ncbi:MAG: hypothetical protein HIU81_14250 [Acidobacteria bacterium]|nr:hypothetical protein [Acidobacteriota bacterium]